jgi:hypothetical protein
MPAGRLAPAPLPAVHFRLQHDQRQQNAVSRYLKSLAATSAPTPAARCRMPTLRASLNFVA